MSNYKFIVKMGGEGSGNWGHEGRPGEVGGSGEGGFELFRKEIQSGKYNNVGEFINNQPKLFFGGKNLSLDSISEKGLSLTTDENIARRFANAKGGKIQEFYFSKDVKIIDFDNIPKDVLPKNVGWEGVYTAAAKWSKNNDYDILNIKGSEKEMRIMNPDVIKTKQELTDFYKQVKDEV